MPLFLSHGEYMLGYRRRGMEVGVDEAPQGRVGLSFDGLGNNARL